LLLWRSGRQYAGSDVGFNRALGSLFTDAEHSASQILDLFEAEICVKQKPIEPEDLATLQYYWQGQA
jgi:hypothetical protein